MYCGTSELLYGPNNPFALNRELIEPLCEFEAEISMLYMNVLPQYTAFKGYQARNIFAAILRSGHCKDAAAIIQGRRDILTGGGYTTDDVGVFNVGILVAATTNSSLAIFWLIIYVYSSPFLLVSIREAVSNITALKSNSSGDNIAEITISAINTRCPFLVSTWQETFRLPTQQSPLA